MWLSARYGDSWDNSLVFRGSRSDNRQMFHPDWYQQRYGSGQADRRKRQVTAAKAAHYEELKELQQERKQTRQDNAVSVFAEHGIDYEVRGHSWLCQVGTQSLYF